MARPSVQGPGPRARDGPFAGGAGPGEEDADVLAVVIDMNPLFWSRQRAAAEQEHSRTGQVTAITCSAVIEGAIVLANAHLLANRANAVVMYASLGNRCHLLYSCESDPGRWTSSFASLDARVNGAIRGLSAEMPDGAAGRDRMTRHSPNPSRPPVVDPSNLHNEQRGIVTCLSTATCRACSAGTARPRLPLTRAAAGLARMLRGATSPKLRGRILVLGASSDPVGLYVPFMNAVFGARNLEVPIDACLLTGNARKELLAQACHMTGGTFEEHGSRVEGFLQLLLASFAAGAHARAHLKVPTSKLELSASCLATHRPIRIGFVCSACLSTFAAWHAQCPICGVAFNPARKAEAEHAASPYQRAQGGWSQA